MLNYILYLSILILTCDNASAGKIKADDEFLAQVKLIQLTGDTLYGTSMISKKYRWNNFEGSGISYNFFFKENGKVKAMKVKPRNVKGFLIRTADSLWASFVSSTQLNFDADEKGFLSGKYFLLKVIAGKMELYHIYNSPEVSMGSGNFSPNPYALVKVLYITASAKLYHSEIYDAPQSKLYKFVEGCEGLLAAIKNAKGNWSFAEIADFYNGNCK